MTKKEIYAAHGIQFDGSRHILYNGKWISELLKPGNGKTGEHVYTFSLPAGIDGTCIYDCVGCYAKTGRYVTPIVKASNAVNLEIVNNDIDFFYRAISAQLETIGRGEIRIHASGDFKTARPGEYAAAWHRIVKENPDFLFWTYTKMREHETLFDDTNNGNIVKSIINGVGYNFGHCDYIIRVYNMLKKAGKTVWVCRCGFDKTQHCENCKHCGTAQFVLFVEHSTDYIAEKDPAFAELKKIVEAQD